MAKNYDKVAKILITVYVTTVVKGTNGRIISTKDRTKKWQKKNICSICGSELGMLAGRIMLEDGVLCTSCGSKLPKLSIGQPLYTLDEARQTIRRMERKNQTSKYTGPIPEYVVLQVVLKEAFVGTGSANLSELEVIINRQAAKGYKLHTISTTNGGSKGAGGGDRIQATLVFEKLKWRSAMNEQNTKN